MMHRFRNGIGRRPEVRRAFEQWTQRSGNGLDAARTCKMGARQAAHRLVFPHCLTRIRESYGSFIREIRL
jgi:hypothetical protein